MSADLLFYDDSDGYAEFYCTSNGSITLARPETGWEANWTHIATGLFGTVGGLTQIVLCNSVTGTFRMDMVTDVPGSVGPDVLVKEIPNWRPGGNQMVVGVFNASEPATGYWIPGFAQLLFYDAAHGIGEIYEVIEGTPGLVNQFTGWRRTWKQIVPGVFNGSYGGAVTDLLFYDASTGTGEFYATSPAAEISLMRTVTGWRKTWKQIVPGNFSGGQQTDLLFYDPDGHVGEFYSVDNGTIHLLEANTGWRSAWDLIVPGNFSNGKFQRIS